MRKYLIIFLVICNYSLAQKLAYIEVLDSKVFFEPPDSSNWSLEQNNMNEHGRYILSFKHIPIIDTKGRKIVPMMSIVAEQIGDSIDVITYSIIKRSSVGFNVQKVLTYDDGHFEYKNVIGYEGDYEDEGVPHQLLIAHMVGDSIGLQVICDSTGDVYNQVENDMRRFIKQVGINE